LFIIAIGLSMDAFAVSICKGLAMEKATLRKATVVGLYFGIFQAGMPLIGYLVGSQFAELIEAFDHWIAFVLLGFIGGKMMYESFQEGDAPPDAASIGWRKMLPLAVATSIDALAVGISFALLNVDIVPAVSLIGVATLVISMAGVKIGNVFGGKFQSKAEFAGGVILVLIGVKILLEHMGVWPFAA
jgi:putative Mn2+ efflux pump MntP